MPTLAKAPTLEDVARLAQVSTATVSRCLNEPDKVKPPTRERVMAAVRELEYSPNFAARVMAAQRTATIGAIVPTMENAIFAQGLQAFEEELATAGLTLLVASSSYNPETEEAQIRTLVARGAEGLLLIGHDRDARILEFLSRQGLPAVAAWAHDPEAALPSVGFDNRAAMAELATEVLARGHRRIAMISAPVSGNDRARARISGVRVAMQPAGLDPSSLTVIETPYGIDNGARAFARLMQTSTPPTAVLCGNDVLAIGALDQARAMGLSVPQDVSVTGFDDIELARVAVPGLTTVAVPHSEMGRQAARHLIGLLAGDPADGVELVTSLRLRGSLGAPPPA